MRPPGLVALGLVFIALVAVLSAARPRKISPPPPRFETQDFASAVQRVDRWFEARWAEKGLKPSEAADELTVLRRLSLGLLGTIPSLEEIRRFEADDGPDRLSRWTHAMTLDPRFHQYFAARLARALVGNEVGPFLIFRRDRLVSWLSEQLAHRTPYDQIVSDLISARGRPTDTPATNFVTAASIDGAVDVNKLTGRTVRAFLGQRIDCAQCHDHPFDAWTQDQFRGLAEFYTETKIDFSGVASSTHSAHKPSVPFGSELLPRDGERRERLAAWVTSKENRRFERATANRVFGMVFGRPLYEPIDDLPDPSDSPDPLDILGRDFRDHQMDLSRMVEVLASTRAFRLSSTSSSTRTESLEDAQSELAIFALVRLRPEQLIGALIQAASITTVDPKAHLFARALRWLREKSYVEDYGDQGDDEFAALPETIPQALLRMNGRLTAELTEVNPFTLAGRASFFSKADDELIEVAFLSTLTRRPSSEELLRFKELLMKSSERKEAVQDLFWALYNSPEMSWNH